MKQEIITYLSTISNDIFNLSKYLYDNPEKSFQEYKAYKYITDILKSNGFNLTEHYLDIETSFYAQYGNGHPKICYICEYDALEEQGHITGHNLISSMSIAAALSLSKVIDKTGGSIIVLGCPGEFISGAKITMVKQGTFDDIDLVLMAHPDIVTAESGTSMAVLPVDICYNTDGYLDNCLSILNKINDLWKTSKANCTIDNIHIHHNKNFSSNLGNLRFYIRAANMQDCIHMENQLKDIITSLSQKFDTKICHNELPYENLITNKTLNRIFSHNLKENGIIDIMEARNITSGLSLGTVSHKVPCIHPYISIVENNNIKYGSSEFALATISQYAHDKVIKTAQTLALTGLDIIEKDTLLSEIKEEFNKKETN